MNEKIQLKEVSVFQNSASFKMIGKYHCVVNTNEIVIDHLTNRMDKNSVRVKGYGPGKIINVVIEKIYSDELIKEKTKQLTKERDDLVKKRTKLEISLKDLTIVKEKTLLAQERFSQEFPKWFSYGKINIESVKDMSVMFREQTIKISKEIEELVEQIEQVQKEIDKMNKTINEMGYSQYAENDAYHKIIVILDADKEDDFTIELSFIVRDAYWVPFYDIKINNSNVDINWMANVYNLTEVDWEDISLNISTADTKPVKLEKPTPYNINEYFPVVSTTRSVRGELINGKDIGGKFDVTGQSNVYSEVPIVQVADAISISGEETRSELGSVDSSMVSNFGVQIYNLKSKFTIKSDKNPKPIHLFKDTLPSITQYFWTTIAPNRVLCNNKVKNKDNLILPGQAKIFVHDEYIGETFLELIAPKQEFKVGERISYDIRIKKIMKEKSKQKEGILKGKKIVSYKYDIEIENLNNVKEQLMLYERLPHSISDKIKIKIGDFSDNYVRNVMNVLKFVINMDKVNKKKVISYDYDVIYDKEITINPPLP